MRQKTDCTKGQSKEAKKEQQTVKQEVESLFEQLACRLIKSEQDKMTAGYLKHSSLAGWKPMSFRLLAIGISVELKGLDCLIFSCP